MTLSDTLAIAITQARSMPLFWLTNRERLHPDHIPEPLGVLAEARVASKAFMTLLNPRSSFTSTVERLRIADGRSIEMVPEPLPDPDANQGNRRCHP